MSNSKILLTVCLQILSGSYIYAAQEDVEEHLIRVPPKSMDKWYNKYFPQEYSGTNIDRAIFAAPEIVFKVIETFSNKNIENFVFSGIGTLISQDDPTHRSELFFSILRFKLDKSKLLSPAIGKLKTLDKMVIKRSLEETAGFLIEDPFEDFYEKISVPDSCSRFTKRAITEHANELKNCLRGFGRLLHYVFKRNLNIRMDEEYIEFVKKVAERCIEKSLELGEEKD